MGGKVSAELMVSTGSLQGCCLSPKLFTLYTSDCILTTINIVIIKYADDTVILGLIQGGDKSGYRDLITDILVYSEENCSPLTSRGQRWTEWTVNTTATVKKAQQRLHFITLLRKFGLSLHLLTWWPSG